jgi:hypothetical protein
MRSRILESGATPVLLGLALLVASSQSAVAQPAVPAAFIDREIERLVELYSDGIAVGYPEYRHVKFAKVLEGEAEAAVALFSVEGFLGGNLHEEYLAVFEPVESADIDGHKTNPYRLLAVQKVGGRGWRTFDWDTAQFARGSVRLKGKSWKAADPGCCPSAPIAVTFRVRDDAIVEARK